MNTNSKHYEILAIEPWEIMEKNFTTEEFVAYLRGNIIKYTLRDKGQALTDAEKIKHYSEKLIEVLKKDKKTEDKHKFKVGDSVRVLLGNKTGTIIRTPVKELKVECNHSYIVELDHSHRGWKATKERQLVDSENAWYVEENDLELLQSEPKKTLAPYKWYDASLYTEDELKELLPVGTEVLVTKWHDNNRTVDLEEEETVITKIKNIGKRWGMQDTRVGTEEDIFWRRYFKIIEEN